MFVNALKCLLPDHAVPMTVVRGPFRGARILMKPRASLRKMFGLYECELNSWLETALRRVGRVLDVGANDGYFTLGCAAAFRRMGKQGEVIGFEPQEECIQALRGSLVLNNLAGTKCEIIQSLVGRAGKSSLDALPASVARQNTLVKVDVEGAEIDVLSGAQSWMTPSNLFVIEVHQQDYLEVLKKMFSARGLALEQIDQDPPFWLGRECRDVANWWLVSTLQPAS